MDNLYFLTEECPKVEVLKSLLKDWGIAHSEDLVITPILVNEKFSFRYLLSGITDPTIKECIIATVSGTSSFGDYLTYKQPKFPVPKDIPIKMIETTKTSDKESRNTGVYQRMTKFPWVREYFPQIETVMLYNNKEADVKKSKTLEFGLRLMKTMGVKVVGKPEYDSVKSFDSFEEIIKAKNEMPAPVSGTPIKIKYDKQKNHIEISAKLSKGKNKAISNDPNIGCIIGIAKCLRLTGFTGNLIVTKHGVNQKDIGKKNKFLVMAKKLNIGLQGIVLPDDVDFPETYWQEDRTGEKNATILAEVLISHDSDYVPVYSNHGGCERGYFSFGENNEKSVAVAKVKKKESLVGRKKKIKIPDICFSNRCARHVLMCEGKTVNNYQQGIDQLNKYDHFKEDYLKKYLGADIIIDRGLIIYGKTDKKIRSPKIMLWLTEDGTIWAKPASVFDKILKKLLLIVKDSRAS